jgi:hypothetical protein
VRKSLLAALAAASVLASAPASAADLMTGLNSDRLSAMLTAAGATQVQVNKPEAGVEIVSFNDGVGTVDFLLMNCAADGCPTMQMVAVFEKDARFTLQAINAYNSKVLNAQAAVMSDGNVALMGLFVFNGGVTEDNLKFNMAIFLGAPELFTNHILSQVTAAADAKGAAQPVAAQASPLTMGVETQTLPPARSLDVLKWLDAKPKRKLP